jgi:hypothetical protein
MSGQTKESRKGIGRGSEYVVEERPRGRDVLREGQWERSNMIPPSSDKVVRDLAFSPDRGEEENATFLIFFLRVLAQSKSPSEHGALENKDRTLKNK